MPLPTPPRRLAMVLLALCFFMGLVSLRLHLTSGDSSMLVLAALGGIISFGVGVGIVLTHHVRLIAQHTAAGPGDRIGS